MLLLLAVLTRLPGTLPLAGSKWPVVAIVVQIFAAGAGLKIPGCS
ncbi:hypothetical protein ACIBQ5_33230 [Streptomyces massasporeus]